MCVEGDTMAENTQFSITLPNQAIEMIEDLIETGLYGANRAEVSRSLILGRLEQLVNGQTLVTARRTRNRADA